ncbi:hypothetical protein EVG20_g10360 [Dentipellis fragilis]|uniref:Oxidase ustYa n=1 Tax=Dentipellis fragilis TaxID=205917 RepID=A0A4Y9XTY1_9AGAM|nr:hypothetical protein EVG20_g10360 [Dentipellis fragilis]
MKASRGSELVSLSILAILCFVSGIFSYSLFLVTRDINFETPRPSDGWNVKPLHQYTYRGGDYPHVLPTKFDLPVQTIMEESVHYGLGDADSSDEWRYTLPYGSGAVRLGRDQRAFIVSMFHAMHCLQFTHKVLTNIDHGGVRHLNHCFGLLRHMSLCKADLTLEPGDFMTRNFTEDAVGEKHICRDWEMVYHTMQDNWVSWFQYRAEHVTYESS